MAETSKNQALGQLAGFYKPDFTGVKAGCNHDTEFKAIARPAVAESLPTSGCAAKAFRKYMETFHVAVYLA
jgi:hypothetical protein